jgi:hypothetical protein
LLTDNPDEDIDNDSEGVQLLQLYLISLAQDDLNFRLQVLDVVIGLLLLLNVCRHNVKEKERTGARESSWSNDGMDTQRYLTPLPVERLCSNAGGGTPAGALAAISQLTSNFETKRQ